MPIRLPNRCLAAALAITAISLLLTGCGGVASGGSNVTGGPTLAATAPALSFGNVPPSKSAKLSETLTNTGDSAVTISDVNVSGSAFSLNGLTAPASLSPGQSQTFTVTFTPASAGSVSGMLRIVSTAQNATLNIALSGTEMAAGQLAISPASLGFGNVVAGGTKSLNATLEATGSSVTISTASSNSAEFVLSGISLPATLAAGQTTSFTVTFKPATSGGASATLSFGSDAANSPSALALTGNGTAPSQHSVDLMWNASTSSDVAGYNIYRASTSGGPYAAINTGLETSTAFTDSTVSAGQTYYYVTTAVSGTGDESPYSNQTKAIVPTP